MMLDAGRWYRTVVSARATSRARADACLPGLHPGRKGKKVTMESRSGPATQRIAAAPLGGGSLCDTGRGGPPLPGQALGAPPGEPPRGAWRAQ